MRRHVYYYTHVKEPFEEVAARLAGDPDHWLPEPAAPAENGWESLLIAEGALPPSVAGLSARVEVGPVMTSDLLVVRPVTWRSTTADRLFPVLTADVELSPLAGFGCHLSLMGSYRPPMSVIGDVGDRLLGHRVAEACVRRFVHDIASRLGTRVVGHH